MALKLYRTRYPNIKRNTPRAQPNSTYYVVFDVSTEPKKKKPVPVAPVAIEPAEKKSEDPKPAAKAKKKKRSKKKYRIPLGQADPEDKNALERIRQKGLQMMKEIKAPPAPKPDEKTLLECLEAELKNRESKLEESTITRYQLAHRNITEGLGASTPISKLTAEDVNLWILSRQQTVSNGTINRAIARLKTVFKYARKKRWVKINIMEEVEKLAEPDGRDRWLTDPEVERLWSVCSPWLWRIIWFSANTGMRRGEQFKLRWDQIRDGMIHLQGVTKDGKAGTKGKKPRWIPLTPELEEILDQVRGDHAEFVFVSEVLKKPIHGSNFDRDYWRPAKKAAGIKDFKWHDLRHTFCSWIVQGGGQLEKVQALAGHAHKSTTQRYAHHAPEHLVDTMSILAKRRRPPVGDVTPIGKAKAK